MYSFMLTLLYRDDETRQQIGIPLCWLLYRDDKTTDRYSFMLTLLYRDDETRQHIGIPLCWLCYTEMTRQNNRYVFLYVDSAIQRWPDKTTDRYSFVLTLLYRDDKTRQQIGIPLCWLCYTGRRDKTTYRYSFMLTLLYRHTRQDNR